MSQPSLGPRKRKETSRITENADPLLPKNKKPKVVQKANSARQPKTQNSTKGKHLHATSTRSSSVEPEDVDEVTPLSSRSSVDVVTVAGDSDDVNVADDSDDAEEDNPAPAFIDVDAEDETLEDSADEELRAYTTDSAKTFAQFLVGCLMKDWTAPIYAFFRPNPIIDHINGRRVHVFTCAAKTCSGKGKNGRQVRRFLATSDATSTSNLRRHANICWTEATVKAASGAGNAHAARSVLARVDLKDGAITTAFERIRKDRVSYSHRQHTRAESR